MVIVDGLVEEYIRMGTSSANLYAYLKDNQQFAVIIANNLNLEDEEKLLNVLRKHKKAIGWTLADLPRINPSIYSIGDGSPTNKAVAEKTESDHFRRGEKGSHKATCSWDHLSYLEQPMGKKLNQATHKDHFPLPFIDQVLEKLVEMSHFRFLDGFSVYMQIYIASGDQHKTTFTCPFGIFAYTRMSFGLCNAPSTFQRCIISIFSDLLKDCMEVFMDDFTMYVESFEAYLDNLSKVLRRCIKSNLVLNFEKCHFMVTEGIVLRHLVSARGIEVDKAKVDVIASLSNHTSVWEDFSKIALPLSKLLHKDVDFVFDQPCVEAFQELKKRLTTMPILQASN
ncbi:Retrovirus-related Pol polyprotein from transposon 17.6, partial [Mucuna pruriens]